MARSGFRIPVRVTLEAFQRDLKDMKEIGRRAATETADVILKEMRDELRKRQGALKEALAKGIIDKQQARQISRDFSKEFNSGILEALKQMRKAGKDNTDEFTKLQRSLRAVADTGTRTGKEIKRGFVDNLANLPSLIRGSLAVGVIASFTYIADRVIALFRNVGRAIAGVIKQGGAVQTAEQSFGALALSSGLDPTRTIEALRRATRGMVSDIELMQRANLALQAGLPATERQLGLLAEGARRLGRATGQDATEAFNRLIGAVVKGEKELLDELGIILNFNEVYKDYATNVLGATRELTEQEKVTARLNAVLEGLSFRVKRLGEDTLTAADRWAQLATFVTNARNAFLEAIVETPKLTALLDAMGTSAENSAEKIEALADRFGATIDAILDSPDVRLLFDLITARASPGRVTQGVGILPRLLGANIPKGIEENLERRQAIRAREDLLERLASIKDISEAQRELFRVTQALNQANSDGAIDVQRHNELLEERRAILQSIERITRPAAASEEKPADDGKAKRIAAERARLQEQLARELAQLTRSAVDESLLQLDKLEREWVAAFGRIDDETADKFASIRESIMAEGRAMEIEDQIRAYGEAHIEAADDVLPLLAGLRALIDGLEAEADQLPENSKARERFIALIRMAEKAMLDLAKAAEEEGKKEEDAAKESERAAQERLRALRDEARKLEDYARAALQVAESLGLIDSSAAKALGSIVELGAGIALATSTGGKEGIPLIIGGATALIGQLFGGDNERAEAIKRNTDALERLRLELEGFQLSGGLLTRAQAAIEDAFRSGGLLASGPGEIGRGGGRAVVQAFARQGISFAELKALADELGIELFDKNGMVTSEGLLALQNALGIATEAVVGFGNSLDEQRAAREFEREIFDDVASAAERAQDELDLLAKNAPDLFDKFFAGIDPSTAEGRAQLEAATREVARLILSGELDPALLGELNGEQLRAFLLNLDDTLDELREQTGEGPVNEGFAISRSITEASAGQMISVLYSIELNTRRAYEVGYGILTALGGSIPANLPIPAPPTQTANATASVQIGVLNVNVDGTQLPPLTTPGAQQELGYHTGIGIRRGLAEEQTDKNMGNRTVNFRRAAGKLRG